MAYSKKTISANWSGSTITTRQLEGFQRAGLISSDIMWRAPGDEIEPSPAPGEVVVFGEHLYAAFPLRPPFACFLRS